MSEQFRYNVFLSYSAEDRSTIRELSQWLKVDGLRVWFDEWEIQPGDVVGKRIEEGLETSRVLLLAMSKHARESDWAKLETATFRFRDPANRERRFVLLRLDNAEIRDSLRQFAYIDWRDRAPGEYLRLLSACRPAVNQPKLARGSEDRIRRGRIVFRGLPRSCWPWVAIAADGRRAVSGSCDQRVRVLDLDAGTVIATLVGHTDSIRGIAISADGRRAVSSSDDQTVRIWDMETHELHATLRGHRAGVRRVAIAADGRHVVSVSNDRTVRVWDAETGRLVILLEGHTASVLGAAISDDGRRVVSGSEDRTLCVWDVETNRAMVKLEGHTRAVNAVAITGDGKRAISGSADRTVRIWDLEAGTLTATLEGHTDEVWGVAVTADGRRAVSASADRSVRIWDLEGGKLNIVLKGHTDTVVGVAITPDGRRAISASNDRTVRVWDLPPAASIPTEVMEVNRYTNAKVLLVGDSGVGKTALSIRLTEDRFEPATSSTDGVQAKRADWATQAKLTEAAMVGGIEREIWVWDFAGQADYRLIHQLFMDETALAVLVFNAQSENPFEGLGSWDRDLQRAARRRLSKLLVAGRADRGGLMVSRDSIEEFRRERGYADYIETSALQGTGCQELRDTIISRIPWEDIPWTASPRIFKMLKDAIIKLKDESVVLLRMAELKQQLEIRLPSKVFTFEQLRAVVGLLAGPGVVWQLEFGDFVLLQPERINSYAAAVIRSVRAHTEDIGCIGEEAVLAGTLDYQDMKRLPHDEEQIVLRAMHQTFVDHGLCLREHTEKGTLLIFPSYFKRERPALAAHPLVLVTYRFSGPLDEIYATLVVRLYHTEMFETERLWRFAADFRAPCGKRLGLKMTKRAEGAAELEVYFESGISNEVQVTFIRYVHEHLKLKGQHVVRLRHYVCPKCDTPVENRRAVETRLERGFKDIVCSVCEDRVQLWDLIEEKFASQEFQRRVRDLEELAKAAIDNESRELILVGHVYAIAGEAGQIYRQYTNSDHGIDGEIEFKDYARDASGKRLYLQLKSGDSYLHTRSGDGAEVFRIKKARWADCWQQQAYPVMLVIRTSDGAIRWMNVSEYLRRESDGGEKAVKQIIFEGEPLTALSLLRLRETLLGPPPMGPDA